MKPRKTKLRVLRETEAAHATSRDALRRNCHGASESAAFERCFRVCVYTAAKTKRKGRSGDREDTDSAPGDFRTRLMTSTVHSASGPSFDVLGGFLLPPLLPLKAPCVWASSPSSSAASLLSSESIASPPALCLAASPSSSLSLSSSSLNGVEGRAPRVFASASARSTQTKQSHSLAGFGAKVPGRSRHSRWKLLEQKSQVNRAQHAWEAGGAPPSPSGQRG